MRDDRQRVLDILEAIQKIEKYSEIVWLAVNNELPQVKAEIKNR